MARFAYSARDRAGKSVSAELDAPSRKDALRLLSARGLQVAQVTELQAGPAPRKSAGKSPPSSSSAAAPAQVSRPTRASTRLNAQAPRRAERLPFLEALHDLTGSGLSAGEAVRLLSTRIKEPRLRTLCAGVWERISEGAPLSRALGGYPEVFDTGTVNLIQAGEATGSLNDTLSRLIAHLVEQRELRAQLMSALAYPVFMVFVSGGVILFFLTFLLPRLQTLLSSLGGKMPASTKLLIGASQFALSIWGIMAVVAVVLALISFIGWRQTHAGRTQTDAWLLKLPLVGPFLVAQTVHSFSQTLSVLLENGITAAEALRMTEKQIANQVHRAAFNTATARVLEGEALSVALTRTGCFPDLVLDRLAIGENTGNVVPSLKSIAAAYQKIITGQLNFFTKVVAGVVLGGVFTFVGFIAFAIVSAVFQVSASFKLGG
ncbi:MAG: secretion system protein [Opitutia bacterium Tous-C4FEB]|nr:MAG: secretion system protein [Opitutae bacterium Tous-C5TDCM]PAW90654.1 MAG: secretion system protein [Opitutae bacterium Tous-C4FEB]